MKTHDLPGQRSAARISEFAYGGEVRPMPDPATATDDDWADYVFNRNGAPGVQAGMVVPHAERHLVHRRARHPAGSVIRTYLIPARRRRMRWLPTQASGSTATGTLDFSLRRPALQGLRGRHHHQRAVAGGRDGAGPQLQISPAARRADRLANTTSNAMVQDGARIPTCAPMSTRTHGGGNCARSTRSAAWLPTVAAGSCNRSRRSCRSASTTRRSTASAGSRAGSACSATCRDWARSISARRIVRTPKRYGFCDVLVIGAGPSGLSAALAAAEQGADVRDRR